MKNVPNYIFILNCLHKMLQTLTFHALEDSLFGFYCKSKRHVTHLILVEFSTCPSHKARSYIVCLLVLFAISVDRWSLYSTEMRDTGSYISSLVISLSTAQSVYIVVYPILLAPQLLSRVCLHGITEMLVVRDLQESFSPPWVFCSR